MYSYVQSQVHTGDHQQQLYRLAVFLLPRRQDQAKRTQQQQLGVSCTTRAQRSRQLLRSRL